jgi:hypothetical protein
MLTKAQIVNFFDKHCWKILRTVIILIFSILLIVWVERTIFPKKEKIVQMALEPTKIYVDREGNNHAEIAQIQGYKEDIKHLKDSLDILVKGKITTITEYVTVTEPPVFKDRIIYVDTNQNFTIEAHDTWTSVKVAGSLKDMRASISPKIVDTITYVETIKRPLFKSNTHIVDLNSVIPYNTITAGRSLTIKERKPIVTLGLQVGYDFIGQKPYVGVGVNFALIALLKTK